MDDLKFSQLISSRLCHDLIAPVGAINSGVELYYEVPDKEEIMQLISQSAATVARRLMFYRIAFGYTAATSFSSLQEIGSLINNFVQPMRIALKLDCKTEMNNLTPVGRFLSNIALTIVEVAPYGGQMDILLTDREIRINLTGDNIMILRPDLVNALEGKVTEDQLTPKNIQAHLSAVYAENLHYGLTVTQQDRQSLMIGTFPLTPSRTHQNP